MRIFTSNVIFHIAWLGPLASSYPYKCHDSLVQLCSQGSRGPSRIFHHGDWLRSSAVEAESHYFMFPTGQAASFTSDHREHEWMVRTNSLWHATLTERQCSIHDCNTQNICPLWDLGSPNAHMLFAFFFFSGWFFCFFLSSPHCSLSVLPWRFLSEAVKLINIWSMNKSRRHLKG